MEIIYHWTGKEMKGSRNGEKGRTKPQARSKQGLGQSSLVFMPAVL